MKRCPKCKRAYDDDTLRFCLEDGAPLSVGRDSEATEILPQRAAPTLKSSGPTVPSYLSAGDVPYQHREARHSNPVLTAGVFAIAVLLLALVGIVAVFVIRQSGSNESGKPNNSEQTGSAPNRKDNSNSNEPARSASPNPSETVTSDSQTGTPLKITATASSVRLAVQSNTYYAANAIDGQRSTAWIEGASGPGLGEWIRFDFDREIKLHRIVIQPGYFKSSQIWTQNNRLAALTANFSDGASRELNFTDRMESQRIDIGSVRTRWVRLVIKSVYYGTNPGPTDDTALSEVAFEWEP